MSIKIFRTAMINGESKSELVALAPFEFLDQVQLACAKKNLDLMEISSPWRYGYSTTSVRIFTNADIEL